MILCITPNAAIDHTLVVDELRAGGVNRAERGIAAAGGKGVNVARAARVLGAQVRCGGFQGGYTGRYLAELAAGEGLPASWTVTQGETRICTMLVDKASGAATVVNEPGPHLSAADWDRLTLDVVRLAPETRAVCVCGSLPPGLEPSSYAALARALQAAGAEAWIDVSGAALAAAAGVPGINIKVNLDEFNAAFGAAAREADHAAVVKLAGAARARHALKRVVITQGAHGAVLVSAAAAIHAQPPAIKLASAVGSGDSMLAGLVHGLTSGASEAEALRMAVAAGAANATSVGGGQFTRAEYERILGQTTLTSY